jgi:hypothetical protein
VSDPYRKNNLLQSLTLGDEIAKSGTDEKPKYASNQHNISPGAALSRQGLRVLRSSRASQVMGTTVASWVQSMAAEGEPIAQANSVRRFFVPLTRKVL